MKKLVFILLLGFFMQSQAQINYVGYFNGTNAYADLGSTISSGVRTVAFYFKPNQTIDAGLSNTQAILIRQDDTEFAEWGFYISGPPMSASDDGKLIFHTRLSDNYQAVKSLQNTWSPDTWYFICGVIDPTEGIKLYVNGTLQGTNPNVTTAIPGAIEPLIIGNWLTASRFFNGRLESLAFWNRALSDIEVQQKTCNLIIPAYETGLTGYYKFDEGSGNTLINQLGIYNGTSFNMVWIVDSTCLQSAIDEPEPGTPSLSVHPNPVKGDLHLDLNGITEPVDLQVFNITGVMISSMIVTSENGSIEISTIGLAPGLYFLKARSGNQTFTAKFTKE